MKNVNQVKSGSGNFLKPLAMQTLASTLKHTGTLF